MTHSTNQTAVAILTLSAGSRDRHRWLLVLLPALVLAASASPAAAGCCEAIAGVTTNHLTLMENIKKRQDSPEYQQELQQKAAILAKIKASGGNVKKLTEAELQFYKQNIIGKLSWIK